MRKLSILFIAAVTSLSAALVLSVPAAAATPATIPASATSSVSLVSPAKEPTVTTPGKPAATPGGGQAAAAGWSGYCPPGYFCMWPQYNGGGTGCGYAVDSKANTADDCGFIQKGQNSLSVENNSGHRVQYYKGTNYGSRVGSTANGQRGNLQGNYQIRSFRPQ